MLRALKPWIIWFVAALFVLYMFLLQSSTSVMIPCLMQAFHINVEQIGFLSASFFYPYLLLQIPAGILVDRFGARVLLTMGLIFCAIASFTFGYAYDLGRAELSRALMGFVSAPAVAAAMYVGANWFPAKRFALIVGLTEGLGMLGGAIGEAYLAECVGEFGWRDTMFACGVAAVVLAILTFTIVRNRPKGMRAEAKRAQVQISLVSHLHKVLRLPQVWLSGAFAGLTFALVSAFAGLWCVPFLQKIYAITLNKAAFGSSLIFIGVAIGAPIAGQISDRMGRRKPVMFYLASLCLLDVLAIAYLSMPLWLMFVLLFLLGMTAATYVIPFAIAREITPAVCRGTVMGFINMFCIMIGAPVLQSLIGYFLNQSTTNFHLALLPLPICLVLSLLLLPLIKETYCRDLQS